MSTETLLALSYAALLAFGAGALEWLSGHTHRRSLLWRTAGFEYMEHHDAWVCPEGEHLWPHEFDQDLRLVRYRARAHVCNACRLKDACTDSDKGREITRPLDSWPHSEAGRFHRGISLVLVALALLVIAAAGARNHAPIELATLGVAFGLCLLAGWWLLRDFRAHPADFPTPAPSHGLRFERSGVVKASSSTGPG